MQRLRTELAEDVLARRAALPRKPSPVVLEGAVVKLVALEVERDVEELHAVSDGRPIAWGDRTHDSYDPDESIWRYIPAL